MINILKFFFKKVDMAVNQDMFDKIDIGFIESKISKAVAFFMLLLITRNGRVK